MQIAADVVNAPSPIGASIPESSPSLSAASLFADDKVIRRNGAMVSVEPSKTSLAITKAFLAVEGGQQIGVDQLYTGATSPFPRMSEIIDLKKERNFFETRVIEYQTGGALSCD